MSHRGGADPWLFLLFLFLFLVLFCVRAVIIRVIWRYMAGDWLARRKRTCFSAAFRMESNLIVSQFSDMFGEVKSMPDKKQTNLPSTRCSFIYFVISSVYCRSSSTSPSRSSVPQPTQTALRCQFPPQKLCVHNSLALKGKSSTRLLNVVFFLHKLCPLASQAFKAQLHGIWNEGSKKKRKKRSGQIKK